MLSFPRHENFDFDPNQTDIESIVLNFVSNSLKLNLIESNSLLTVKTLTNGLSNTLFAVHSSENQGVVVRIYGKNSDLVVDHQAEIRFMIYLAQFHMSPSILLTFNNGFIYQYVPGTPIQNGDQDKSLLIARKLAEFHSIPLMDKSGKGQLVDKLRHYINLLNGINKELYRRIKLSSSPVFTDISWSKLTEDINQMEVIFNNEDLKWKNLSIVVCHNDTQSLNFLYDEKKNNYISLIDFEHCARNIWLYDVFNHFIESTGFNDEEPDYENAYPIRDKQKQWLEIYLSNALFLNDKIEKQMTIDELCDLGDCLRAPIHLYWSLWAFVEALLSSESMQKFDYIKYGKWRLKYYEKYKNEFFSSVKQ
ncbi:unnamed protein product [Rotaria sordida]|uniref:ethanolamine kinase n=1 Tax=Rotaria sordida TaxID=392033 RepID=A0A814X0U7_9BILA|nr:unnamed protein product [Rotaria sordida]CAF1293757.1 unnamed protein product [Rotaria sordida]CAF3557460.1 unnamed protein product [Rotaria sordida]CAF3665236.1 unnamed protein product [Rotaria sordida]